MEKPWLKIYEDIGIKVPEFDDRPLGHYIEHFARTQSDAPALQFASRQISYGELDSLSNQLANALTAHGISRGDVVGLHMPNIPQYIIALIAISKMGAIGSGLSPLLAPPELAHQIDDASMKAVISLSDLSPVIANMDDTPNCLSLLVTTGAGDMLGAPAPKPMSFADIKSVAFLTIMNEADNTFKSVETHADDIFMIQYTGGTTGRPKGAQLSIRSLVNNPRQVMAGDPPVSGDGEVYASAFPYFHIAGLTFAIGGLMFGAHSMLIPNPRDTDNFCDLMLAYPPTRLAAVPALYDMLLSNTKMKEIDFSRLVVAKTGAAPMTETTRKSLESVIGENKVSDVFGMTETGPCYTFHPLPVIRDGSVGLPVPHADVRIMDVETGQIEMPFGEVGEICSSGPQTMKGYLNLPDETAHALREIDGKTWMYSGDVGYMDKDGYIFLCDRAKDMLIVGGFKVFSVEVEDKLKALPHIAESAVVGAADTGRPGNDIVHLFVQLNDSYKDADKDSVISEIIDFIRTNMAAYKVPKAVHIIDAIPLTPVGKIDKKALRKQLID